jgi:hypothetical protein
MIFRRLSKADAKDTEAAHWATGTNANENSTDLI